MGAYGGNEGEKLKWSWLVKCVINHLERHINIVTLLNLMNTIALQGTAANQPEAKAHKRGKAKVAASSTNLTEKLREALEDVTNGRVHTVDPEHYREGFKELIEKKKSS